MHWQRGEKHESWLSLYQGFIPLYLSFMQRSQVCPPQSSSWLHLWAYKPSHKQVTPVFSQQIATEAAYIRKPPTFKDNFSFSGSRQKAPGINFCSVYPKGCIICFTVPFPTPLPALQSQGTLCWSNTCCTLKPWFGWIYGITALFYRYLVHSGTGMCPTEVFPSGCRFLSTATESVACSIPSRAALD